MRSWTKSRWPAPHNFKSLESLKHSLADNRDIPQKQRSYLEQSLADSASSLKGVTDPQEDALAEAMNKLGDASRAGHGHGGGHPSRAQSSQYFAPIRIRPIRIRIRLIPTRSTFLRPCMCRSS